MEVWVETECGMTISGVRCKAVREEVGRVRVAQKVFPSTVVNNVLPVAVNRAVPFGAGPFVPKVAQV